MNVLLIRPPVEDKWLYVNPFGLQELFVFISNNFSQHVSSIKLVDCQAGEPFPIVYNSTLLFIDTPDGAQEYLASNEFRSSIVNCKYCFLIGEIVNDGDSKGVIDALDIEYCSHVNEWNLEKITNIIQEYIDPSLSSKPIKTNSSITGFGFTDAIISATNRIGDRFHIPAITSGCEHNCTFCHLNISNESLDKVRAVKIDIELVLSELENKCQGKSYNIQFTDENFFGGSSNHYSDDRLKRISILCDTLSKYEHLGRIGIDTRCDTVINVSDTPELSAYRDYVWKKMINSGLDYVYLGIESAAATQIKRYGKNFSPSNVLEAINYLRSVRLNFTIGMILFDSMVTEEEIRENIRFIKENNLNRNMASLLKEMRYYINSPYVRILKHNKLIAIESSHDYLKYDPDDVIYRSPVLRENIYIIRIISNLFRRCGYRHSDMTRLMHHDDIGELLAKSHGIVIDMEIAIIELSLFCDNIAPDVKLKKAMDIVITTIESIYDQVANFANIYDDSRISYFRLVLENVMKSTCAMVN